MDASPLSRGSSFGGQPPPLSCGTRGRGCHVEAIAVLSPHNASEGLSAVRERSNLEYLCKAVEATQCKMPAGCGIIRVNKSRMYVHLEARQDGSVCRAVV